MTDNILQEIQQLQFTDKPKAEALLIDFIQEVFPLEVATVELRPQVISLNSFNGFLRLTDGKRLFFKTHTESDNVIGEYYRAAALANGGYPVIQPIYQSTEAGKQLLIYEVIESPSVFDVAWEIETGNSEHAEVLTLAQHRSDDELFQLYVASFSEQTASAAAEAPVHQLFHHRLTKGRLQRFYGRLPDPVLDDDRSIQLPGKDTSMVEVSQAHWVINGQEYAESLNAIVRRAVTLLEPEQGGVSVLGHGDAHNGNVFLRLDESEPDLLYFDPAFVGTHDPLMDLTKPLFHNVFAMWMYFPQEKNSITSVSLDVEKSRWIVTHDYRLHPIREMFLRSKVDRVLIPILRHLRSQKRLRQNWREYLKAALFCCPFLTMNLADNERFPPAISLLGLAMSIEMGAESQGNRSVIDKVLDEVEDRL